MTTISAKILMITLVFVFMLAIDLSIVYSNTNSYGIYGQQADQLPHPFNYIESGPKNQKYYNIQSVDQPLNLPILEQKNDSNNINSSNKTTRSSDLSSSDSTLTTPALLQENFRKGFCGINSTTTEYTDYILEYTLPQSCEMPLGIAVDSEDKQVWYVSTRMGILGMYDITRNEFEQYTIPQWYVRDSQRGFSQVWDVKIDKGVGEDSDEIWFTDTAQNAIWRFKEATKQFEMYKIPGQSESFGTTYPITINIVTNESADTDSEDDDDDDIKSIFFIGTFVPSLWYAEINDLRNGTAEGIHEVKLPIEYSFKSIDPFYVTSGSFEFDEEGNSAWISMLSYSRKGQILEYDLDSKSFNIFGLPEDLSSPLGIVIDDDDADNGDNKDETSTELWITNPGTSIFYNYKINEHENKKSDNDESIQIKPREASGDNASFDVDIERYTTSKASPRIFGLPFYKNSDNETQVDDLRNRYYTLPSWIKKSSDASIWFNQQQGNKISRFDLSEQELTEYWIPSQNYEWGNCEDGGRNNEQGSIEKDYTRMKNCGIANVLNFALMESNDKGEDEDRKDDVIEVWFTEWSTNKIGRINISNDLPFDIEIQESERELTVKRGESEKIDLVVDAKRKDGNENDENNGEQTSSTEYNDPISMTSAGTFTPTGYLGNSTGYFDTSSILYSRNSNDNDDDDNKQKVSFVFTPSNNMIPGDYTLMLGAEDKSVSILKAIKIRII
jgi:virginiamycin B lyase